MDLPRGNDLDRGRGFLSSTDRKFLLGEKDYQSSDQERTRRLSIRKRILNAFLDFGLVLNNLQEDELSQIAEYLTVEPGTVTFVDEDGKPQDAEKQRRREVVESIMDTIAFAILLRENVAQSDLLDPPHELATILEGCIRKKEKHQGNTVKKLDIEIDFSRRDDLDDLYEKFDQQEYLTAPAIRSLYENGRITFKDIVEYQQGQPDEDDIEYI